MLIYDVPLFQFAIPVLVVILCVFLIFAFGFKSPGTPPTLIDVHEDDEKVHKTKRIGGKKSVKLADSSTSTGSSGKHAFVAPTPKQVNNIHNNIKTVPVVDKVQAKVQEKVHEKIQVKVEQPKQPKAKKPAKKVDENANIMNSVDDGAGDWVTAISKKNRKNLNKKKEPDNGLLADLKVIKEEAVETKVADEEIKEEKLEVEERSENVTPASPVVPEVVQLPEVVQDGVSVEELLEGEVKEEVKEEEVKTTKKQKKSKKVEKVFEEEACSAPKEVFQAMEEEEEVMVCPDAQPAAEEVIVPPPAMIEVVEPMVEQSAGEITKEPEVVKTSKKKKKKTPESREMFQEILPLTTSELKNEEEFMIQTHQPVAEATSSKKSKSKQVKSGETKEAPVNQCEQLSQPSVGTPSDPSLISLPVAESVTKQATKDAAEEEGDWKQAKPSRRRRNVQKEH